MNPPMRRAAAAVVSGMLLAALLGGPAAAASSGRAALVGSVPSWATASNFKNATSSTSSVGFRVYLG